MFNNIGISFAVAKIIKLGDLGKELNNILKDIEESELKKADRALRATIIDVWGKVITETPVDSGRARGNWFIDDTFNPSQVGASQKRKGANYVRVRTKGGLLGKTKFLYNNLPYVKKLEFGGYSGSPTDKTVGGFSRLAPNGMVRKNLANFARKLARNWKGAKRGV